ncbi:hypothetical protein Moror_4965 [Moniliophthora roreri MCA 2997]|nr:hypothetical protein Moror_4965 [Moniliophthora roreri MCA 2997]
MYAFKSLIAASLLSCALALQISTPSAAKAGADVPITWQSNPNDASDFTLFLLDNNNLPFGLEQNFGKFQTTDGQAIVTFDSDLSTEKTYVLRAVNSENVDFVYASSAAFTLVA